MNVQVVTLEEVCEPAHVGGVVQGKEAFAYKEAWN